MLEGVPIDAGVSNRTTFELSGGQAGASRGFGRIYQTTRKAISADVAEEAKVQLRALREKSGNL